MAITTEYLDGISFEIAKQKYYNANKVNAKMEEIKSAVAELIAENEMLRAELVEMGSTKERIAELMISTQAAADKMLAEAKAEAEQIIADAKSQAESIELERSILTASALRSQNRSIITPTRLMPRWRK